MPTLPRFHLAFPVHDLEKARAFYGGVLGCREGRSSDEWVDFDFFGHQIVAHLTTGAGEALATNEVDGDAIPVRHFGVILEPELWKKLADHLRNESVPFIVNPHVRFQGRKGEQWTMFVTDPSGNVLEFKAFTDDAMVFERELDVA